jgi:hypothetical protein
MITFQGMQGLGDNIHSRAVVRGYQARGERVQIITPWPSVFTGLDVACIRQPSAMLRTQAKNIRREAALYKPAIRSDRTVRIWYEHDHIRRYGGFLEAMCAAQGVDPAVGFDMQVPLPWIDRALARIAPAWKADGRPLMVYRPLVERTEWVGCSARNPDALAYADLLAPFMHRYFIVSIADLEPGVEWLASAAGMYDLAFHSGELDFQEIAGLVALADLVWCSPGFMLPLAQAIGSKLVCVFGGHESARFYNHGGLLIEPIHPCECFSKTHRCDKTIDIPTAIQRIEEYLA